MATCEQCKATVDDDLPFCVYCGTPLPAAGHGAQAHSDDATPWRIDQRYTVLMLVGAGGMGEVYQARDDQSGDLVAIKIILPDLVDDPVACERFNREIHSLQQVHHPHVVRVLHTGVDAAEQRPYFVMQYLDGPTLEEYVEAKGPLPPAVAIDIMEKVLGALGAIHQQGWVHRDLKAANVILAQPLEDGRSTYDSAHVANADTHQPMLLDMGIARATGVQDNASDNNNLTMMGDVVGTPEAMAPEQILGGAIDARTDIYQAGALLLQLLLGRPAFSAGSTKSWYGVHLSAAPSVGQDGAVPIFVAQACLKAMEKDPDKRFASTDAMIRALHNMPTEAHTAAGAAGGKKPAQATTSAAPPSPATGSWLKRLFGKK